MYEPKIGDWVKPIDAIVGGINYGYNNRLVIGINGDLITTVCYGDDIEEGLWNIYNIQFLARVELGE